MTQDSDQNGPRPDGFFGWFRGEMRKQFPEMSDENIQVLFEMAQDAGRRASEALSNDESDHS